MAAPLSLDLICRVSVCRRLLSPLVLSQTFIKAKSSNFDNNAGQKLPCRSFANMACAGNLTAGPSSNEVLVKLQSNFASTFLFPAPFVSGLKSGCAVKTVGLCLSRLVRFCRQHRNFNLLKEAATKEYTQYTVSTRGAARNCQPCFWVPSRNYGRKLKQRPPKITHFEYSGDLRTLPELDKNVVLYKYKGVEDQLEGNEVLRKLSTLEFASAKEISKHHTQLIKDRMIALFGPDCELEQEIALLTLQIRKNIPRCIQIRSDKFNKSVLVGRINHRRNLLTSLRSLDHERFEWLLRELKIRYVVLKDREEDKGWKYNTRIATQEEAREKQRKKLEQLKAKFESEKANFFQHKAAVISKIEEDLNTFGLDWNYLKNLIKSEEDAALEKQKQQQQQQLRLEASIKEETNGKKGKRA